MPRVLFICLCVYIHVIVHKLSFRKTRYYIYIFFSSCKRIEQSISIKRESKEKVKREELQMR